MSTRNHNVWESLAAGAIGGLVASFTMNQFQALWSKASEALAPEPDKQPQSSAESDDATIKTANAVSQAIFHHKLSTSEKKWAGPAVHYGFGTLVGAAYGALNESVPIASAGGGIAFGTAVWFLADEVMVPATGLSGPATAAPLSSHVYALASHLVYGVVTDSVRRLVLTRTG